MSPTPEKKTPVNIDAALESAGWVNQDPAEINLAGGPGNAVHEFPMAKGHGFADYMLFFDTTPIDVLESK